MSRSNHSLNLPLNGANPPMDWDKLFNSPGVSGAERVVRDLLDSGISVTSFGKNGKTALHVAAKYGNIAVAKLLINQGANVNATRRWPNPAEKERRPTKPSWLWTPLHYGAKSDNGDMIQLLIDSGADMQKKSLIEETPLDVAFRKRTETALWVLIQNGAGFTSTPYTPSILGALPNWASDKLERRRNPESVIMKLERDLMHTFLQWAVGATTQDRRYCDRCNKKLSQKRANLVEMWRGEGSFNYGFLKRCELCMTSLTTLPEGMAVLPTLISKTPSSIRSGTPEEDLEYIFANAQDAKDDSTGSRTAFTFAKYWLLRCLKSHRPCCGLQDDIPVLPARVIDVGSHDFPPRPVLYEPRPGEQGLYCALSYRRIPFTIKTKKKFLSFFKKPLDWRIFPRVVQDAIVITKTLGIRYLWVDAFCIVQDDQDDWKKEVPKMHETFRNALLTIAVVEAMSKQEGIFHPRNGRKIRRIPRRRPYGTLDTRGWTLQEQLLSPRVLSYTDDQLFWDCQHLTASESCPAGIPPDLDDDHRDEDFRISRNLILGPQDIFLRPKIYRLWRKLVGDFTQRELTNESDRLPAIQGIASAISAACGDKLLVGLWVNKFIMHLAWWVKPESSMMSTTAGHPDRLSWSWVSVEKPVTYECISSHHTSTQPERCLIEGWVSLAQVIRHDLVDELWELSYSHGSVSLEGGVIKVKNFNVAGEFHLAPSSRAPASHYPGYCRAPPPHNRGYEVWYPDHSNSISHDTELFCFILGTGNTGLLYSLVLTSTFSNAPFRRVGLCAWNRENVSQFRTSNIWKEQQQIIAIA